MSSRYGYSLRERAALTILTANDEERRELLELCDTLARSPSRSSAESVVDETGRTNEVTYTAHFRVAYWADHAVKEIRIVDIRRY